MADRSGFRRWPAYFLSVAAMAVVYFLLSDKMLTSLKFREAVAPRMGPLSRILPVEFNWGLPVLALLLLYWAAVWLLDRGRPRHPGGRDWDQRPLNRREKDIGGQEDLEERTQPPPAHLPRENPVAK